VFDAVIKTEIVFSVYVVEGPRMGKDFLNIQFSKDRAARETLDNVLFAQV